MAEGQSRYGIMSELNENKIKRKENLTQVEQELDNREYETERIVSQLEKKLSDEKGNYKYKHQVWKREQEARLRLMITDHLREQNALKKLISDRDSTYEEDFQSFEEATLREIDKTKESFEKFKKQKQQQIEGLKDVVNEIEKSISDLKEMSEKQA